MLPVPVIQLRTMTTTATDVDVTTAMMLCGVFLGLRMSFPEVFLLYRNFTIITNLL